jgi:hypothetical protein
MTNSVDITDLLFSLVEESEKDKQQRELWNRATDEAYHLVGIKSPMNLLRKSEELYNKYLGEIGKSQ